MNVITEPQFTPMPLYNFNNSCFANVIIQALISCKLFNKIILQNYYKNQTLQLTGVPKIIQCYIFLILCFFLKETKYFLFMVKNLKQLFKQIINGKQQDCHEFLIILMNYLNENMFFCKNVNIKKTSIVQEFFYGQMLCTTICQNCSWRNNKQEIFQEIILNIPNTTNNKIDLTNLFDYYFQKNQIKNFDCPQCQNNDKINNFYSLVKLPHYLFVIINRFSHTTKKKNNIILEFGPEFNFTNYFNFKIHTLQETIFKLISIIIHSGQTTNSGHYYSFNKIQNIWYKCDDTSIQNCVQTKTFLQNYHRQNVYLLLYEKN